MIELQGNYYLNLNIGGADLPISPGSIKELTITQDIDRLLPTFRMALNDATGNLGNLVPYDSLLNKVRIDIARFDPGNINVFNFSVKRRLYGDDSTYEVVGTLNTPDLIKPSHYRALPGNIRSTIQTIAGEMGIPVKNTEIDPSLDYDKVILQPGWTNGKLLTYLKNNAEGKLKEGGYYAFIKNVHGAPTLVFKSVNALYGTPIKHKLIVGPYETLDLLPVISYEVRNDSAKINDFAGEVLVYGYFDYDTGKQVESSISIDEAPAITPNFLVNRGDISQMSLNTATGRSNGFTETFDGMHRNAYYSKLGASVHMWATTWGSEHIAPGDTVLLVYSESMEQSDFFSFQHSGKWMVKRVVHTIGDTFTTNLLLTRSGIDTQFANSLHPATNILK